MNTNFVSAWSGGGEKISVFAGYAKYMAERGIRFRCLTGTSSGSIAASMYALGKVDELIKLVTSLNTEGIYNDWLPLPWKLHYLSKAFGLVFRRGAVNPKPYRKMLQEHIDVDALIASDQKFYSCSVDCAAPFRTIYIPATEEYRDLIIEGIYASSAFTGLFPPGRLRTTLATDGGIRENVPAWKAVSNREPGAVAVICLSGPIGYKHYSRADLEEPMPKTGVGLMINAIQAMMDEIALNDMAIGNEKYWSKDENTIVLEPTVEQLQQYSKGTMIFDKEYAKRGVDIGYEIAKEKFEAFFNQKTA